MSDFQLLSPETRRAFNRIASQFQHTGQFPRSRAAARNIAESERAPISDVLALSGFQDQRASPPAKRISKFLHGARKE